MKICSLCNQSLPRTEFQIDRQKPDGLRAWCRRCRSARQRHYVTTWIERRQDTPEPEAKTCSKCLQTKPITDFVRDKCRPDGFHVWCKNCKHPFDRHHRARRRSENPQLARERERKKWLADYGLTPEQFEAMIIAQDGKCMICDRPPKDGPNGTSGWNVDHDHLTDQIRALLCGNCNRGLGLFQDSPDICERAAAYLRKTRRP